MSLLENGVLTEIHVDVAPDADLSAGPLSWPWEELAEFTYADPVAGLVSKRRVKGRSELQVQAGRASGSAAASPGSVGFTVDNADEAFTPGHPLGLWYPGLREGTPVRVRVPGPTVALLTDGDVANNLSTPTNGTLNIVGDIGLRYEGDIDWWRGSAATGVGGSALIGKYKSAGNQRSYLLWVTGGRLVLTWSAAGTEATVGQIASTVLLPWSKGRHAVWATLDVNNGASGRTVTFYTSDSIAGPWTLLEQLTESGTTAIFSSNSPVEVGVVTGDDTTSPPTGRTFAAQVIAGLPGTDVRAYPNLEAQSSGATSFADSVGRTWTAQGNAEVTSDRVRRIFQLSSVAPRWEQLDPIVARADIQADGVLRRLGQGTPALESVLFRAVTSPTVASNVIAAWPMEDESGATSFASPIPGVQPATFGGEASLSSETSLAASSGLPSVSSGDGFGWLGHIPRRTGLTQWALDYFVLATEPDSTERTLIEIFTTGTARRWRYSLSNAAFFLRVFDADDTEIYSNGVGMGVFNSGWVHLSLYVTQDGADIDFNVVFDGLAGSAFGYAATIASNTIGSPTRTGTLATAVGSEWSFGHAIVSAGLDLAWLGWNEGAHAAYDGEKAGARIMRLCAEEGIPARIVGNPDNTERMGPQGTDTLIGLLGECAEADDGFLGEDPESLGLLYRTRASLLNQEPALTLDRETRGLVDPFAPVLDAQRRKTHVTVSRSGGSSSTQVALDWDEETDPRYTDSGTVNVESDLQLPDIAARRAHVGSTRDMRLPAVATNLVITGRNLTEQAAVAERLAAWLDLGVGDLVRVENPPGTWPTSVDLLVDQLTDILGTNTWEGRINGSPAGPWVVGVRDDDTLGVRDTAGSELAAPFTSGTSTSMSVATTLGPLWTTNAAHMPLVLDVAGVQLQVTAISGGSSPQTFTVTQAPLNGFAKTIPTGTPVRVWSPAIRNAA